MFSERIAEALAGTQSIAIVGDDARDMLYASAATWGFQLASMNLDDIASLENGHPHCDPTSKGHWLLVVESADAVRHDLEDMLLDLVFDGCRALPANTLIAVHFSKYCDLSEALSDEDVPITYLEMETAELPGAQLLSAPIATITPKIARVTPTELHSIPLAA